MYIDQSNLQTMFAYLQNKAIWDWTIFQLYDGNIWNAYIGITDDAQEGNWVYMSTGKSIIHCRINLIIFLKFPTQAP